MIQFVRKHMHLLYSSMAAYDSLGLKDKVNVYNELKY